MRRAHARIATQCFTVLAGCFATSAAMAQEQEKLNVAPPQQSLPGQDPFSGFTYDVIVSTDDGKAKTDFSYSGYLTSLKRRPSDSRRNDLTWKGGISIPIGGKTDLFSKGTLDNLANGTKFSIGTTLLSISSNPTAFGNSAFVMLWQQAVEQCKKNAGLDQAKLTACQSLTPREGDVRTYAPWLELQMNRALYKSFWTLSAEVSVAVARYSLIEPETLNERKDNKTGYSAKITFSKYFADAVSRFRLEAEYSDAPDKANTTIICKPTVVIPADDCKTGSINFPERKDALILRGGYARYFPFRTGKAGIGVELTGSKDALSKDWAIEAPVYLTIPGITQISPGIKASYASKSGENDFVASVFVKTAFSL